MRILSALIFIFGLGLLQAQELDSRFVPDDKYLEDQFYVGVTYNILLSRPAGVSQRNLSYGLFGGFIKDLPINADRNIGFGIGVGYGLNSYYTNLRASETVNGIEYEIIGNQTPFKRNKIETHALEFPVEFRWRTSNNVSHKFWRIYTGLKFGYVFGARSRFVSDLERTSFSNEDIRQWQYGLIMNFGYNTFNVHAYYSLQKLFKDDVRTVDGEAIQFVPLHIGISFYIL